jgi:hypothetical protein
LKERLLLQHIESKKDDITEAVKNIVNAIEDIRAKTLLVKHTPNNKKSSRGHLYITFEVVKEGNTSYFTIIDMGGRENPLEILTSYFSNTTNMTQLLEPIFNQTKKKEMANYAQFRKNAMWNSVKNPFTLVRHEQSPYIKKIEQKQISNMVPSEKEEFIDYIRSMYMEGLYINETINQLKIYFERKLGIKNEYQIHTKDLLKYDPKQPLTNSVSETLSSMKERIEEEKKSAENSTILTPIIVYWLDEILKPNNSLTKFFLICNIKAATNGVFDKNDIDAIAEFTKLIKSTGTV